MKPVVPASSRDVIPIFGGPTSQTREPRKKLFDGHETLVVVPISSFNLLVEATRSGESGPLLFVCWLKEFWKKSAATSTHTPL